jgi:hypothetical protein
MMTTWIMGLVPTSAIYLWSESVFPTNYGGDLKSPLQLPRIVGKRKIDLIDRVAEIGTKPWIIKGISELLPRCVSYERRYLINR